MFFSYTRLSKKGVPAEGVIFDLENVKSTDLFHKYPVVRFTTSSNEWITETYKIGLFPGFYKKGAKVKIFYNPDKPSDFVIKSTASVVVPAAFAAMGIFLLATGIIQLMDMQLY